MQLPTYIESVRDKLAENIHELWALGKIEQGWTFGEVRLLHSGHFCLTLSEKCFCIFIRANEDSTVVVIVCANQSAVTERNCRRTLH